MQTIITISGKKIDAIVTCQIRNVMTSIATRLWRYFLDARFFMRQLAGLATAQRIAVPVRRRCPAVGVMRRSSARMAFHHSHRSAGPWGGPWSEAIDNRL